MSMLFCPYCDFRCAEDYLTVHMDSLHRDEAPPPNRPVDGTSAFDPFQYQVLDSIKTSQPPAHSEQGGDLDEHFVICPRPGCGEPVSIEEIETHLSFHDGPESASDRISRSNNGGLRTDHHSSTLSDFDTRSSTFTTGTTSTFGLTNYKTRYEKLITGDDEVDDDIYDSDGESVEGLEEGQRIQMNARLEHDDYRPPSRTPPPPPPYALDAMDEGGLSRQAVVDMTPNHGGSQGNEISTFASSFYATGGIHRDIEAQSPRHQETPTRSISPPPVANHIHKDPPVAQYGGYASGKKPEVSIDPAKLLKKKKQRFKKSELGPYANEKRMPKYLIEQLRQGGREIITQGIGANGKLVMRRAISNETEGLIPVISGLSAADPSVLQTWLCHPGVKHVGKEVTGGGGFCGYRNIQMMISFCQVAPVVGGERFIGARIPDIITMQHWIEEAWDMGMNTHARDETGGIKFTRKYIGASEAQALFERLGIMTIPSAHNGASALSDLIDQAYQYFSTGVRDTTLRVIQTERPPLYFQHLGHSMTIIGVELSDRGVLSLLVLDPMYAPSNAIKSLTSVKYARNVNYNKLLAPHRRGRPHLRRFKNFELLELVPDPQAAFAAI